MNKKSKVLVSCLTVCMLCLNTAAVFGEDATAAAAPTTQPSTAIQVDAKAAILMEPSTGKVVYEQNSNERLAPASVTKIMTLLLIYDAVAQKKISWDDVVSVSDHAASMGGSQIFLEPGEKQTVKDLTKSIAVASANDAAVAMAEYIGGSEEGFVDLMNRKAAELSMTNTHFENACGLDTDNHLTTALDIALMSRELMNKYPDVREYTTKWQDTITHKTKRGDEEFGLTNTNKLIKWYDGATGLKTGSTGKALYCLSATAERNGLNLIAVIMAAPDPTVRFREAMKLLDYGFANFAISFGEPAGKVMGSVKVYKGETEEINAVVKNDVQALVEKGTTDPIEPKVQLVEAISAPFEAGAKVGEIVYMYRGKEVGRSDLVAEAAVKKAGLPHMIGKLMIKWFE